MQSYAYIIDKYINYVVHGTAIDSCFCPLCFFKTLHGLVVCSIADVSLWLSSVRIYIQYETGILEHSEKIDDMGRPMIFRAIVFH